MIHLVYGIDRPRIKKRVGEILKSFPEPHSTSLGQVFWITADQFSESKIDELSGARGLFVSKYAVVCDGFLGNKDAVAYFTDKLKEISESPNLFIFMEGSFENKELDLFKKFSDKVEEFPGVDPDGHRGLTLGNFNLFSLCDALGERNKKNLWILYNKALSAGVEADQIFWKLAWQAKNLLLAKKSEGGKTDLIGKLKMNPFVASKAVRYAKGWTEAELTSLYKDLLDTYHNARLGVVDIETA
ncbi:MAG: hypothetical protein AAB965_00020, partial [Patescibacteria group bacterium]